MKGDDHMIGVTELGRARDKLLDCARRCANGPLGLHHALMAAIAALDAGGYGYLAAGYRATLDEHTGGWFGLAPELRMVLEALDNVERWHLLTYEERKNQSRLGIIAEGLFSPKVP